MGFTVGNARFGRTLYPVFDVNVGNSIWYHDDSNFDCEEAAQYVFKTETANLQSVTIRSVAIRYVNIEAVTVTVTVSGTGGTRTSTLTLGLSDPTITGDIQQNTTYYGNPPPKAIADGKNYVAYFNFSHLTTEDYTVTLDIAANGGALQLIRLYVLGEGEEISR